MENQIPREYRKDAQGREPIAGPGICMTQDQIAKAIGVSRARIHAIEYNAIRKIKDQLKAIAIQEGIFDEQ